MELILIKFIIYTYAFPTVTCTHVVSGKGLFKKERVAINVKTHKMSQTFHIVNMVNDLIAGTFMLGLSLNVQ